MNLLTLTLADLRHRALACFFNALTLALGIALLITLLQIGQRLEQRFRSDLQGVDLVVGAKGSPIQLILSSVFHLDVPTGNIPLLEAKNLEHNPLVKAAIPEAMGDNYEGFPIVGTTTAYPEHYGAQLLKGGYWSGPMQAVLGSQVAHKSLLKVGEKFAGSHGLSEGGEEHTEFPYTVTGILKPTGSVVDRLIFTDVSSVWNIHEHHHEAAKGLAGQHKAGKHKPRDHDAEENDNGHHGRELTAMLISYSSPYAAVMLPRLIDKTSSMQAASPAFEVARLLKIIGVGGETVALFGGVLIVIGAAGFFVTLFNAVNERRYDIVLLRCMGATRGMVFSFVLAEGMTLGVFGTVLGLVMGHGFAYSVKLWLEQHRHMVLQPIGVQPAEYVILIGALAISVLASIAPAVMAYHVNVAEALSKGR